MFRMASSPHVHSHSLTAKVMLWVIAAMIPAIMVQIYYFGFGTLIQLLLAVIFAVLLEWIVTRLRAKKNFADLSDMSVILTAIILAVAIPPYAPYWIILLGVFCAVILGKQVYGGLGQNPFNPAMVGYAILLVSFPAQMTAWALPNHLLLEPTGFKDAYLLIFQGVTSDGYSLHQLTSTIDGITQATPLDSVKTGIKNHLTLGHIAASPIFQHDNWQDNLAITMGIGWWQLNFAFLVGGLFLIWKKSDSLANSCRNVADINHFCYCNLADCAANLSITAMATLFRRNNVRCLFYCYRSGNGIYYAKRKIIIR